ncbi:MAG: hypothetical protein HQ528_10685 [Candidatus Marinimicrobia bacterium]|nr:hypothetical protein [Candidatus Neomarinimicrobiota bacterium]
MTNQWNEHQGKPWTHYSTALSAEARRAQAVEAAGNLTYHSHPPLTKS